MSTKLSPEQLQKVKELLPSRSISKVAKATGFSSQAVRDVLKGRYENDTVLNMLIDIAETAKQTRENIAKRLDNILSEPAKIA